ncbi:MAG: NlpC/P60 family protein, partial [Hymenobacter sp.]
PALPIMAVSERRPAPTAPPRADSIVRFALAQLGTNYCYAGTSPSTGFDCSGFVQYVFTRFHVAVPHATALLIDAGRPVPRAQARPGDIVVFTGTAPGSSTPGHAGIVISALGETPLRFVHSSSARREPGVKISQVENSGYEQRFMQVRRVL